MNIGAANFKIDRYEAEVAPTRQPIRRVSSKRAAA